MNPRKFITVDPRTLRLPPSRIDGADQAKLQRQFARYGRSIAGMPPLFLGECTDGELMIIDGITRATRAATHLPGQLVPAEITELWPQPGAPLPLLGDSLP